MKGVGSRMSHVRDCLCVPGAKCTLRAADACVKQPTPEILAITRRADNVVTGVLTEADALEKMGGPLKTIALELKTSLEAIRADDE